MYRDFKTRYKVFIEFNQNRLCEEEVNLIVRENFDEEVLRFKGFKLELLWEVPEREGSHEIDNELHYILEDGEYGSYSYEFID